MDQYFRRRWHKVPQPISYVLNQMAKAESILHWTLWVLAVCYGLHSVWRVKYKINFPDYFVANSVLGQRDQADFEWETWLLNALLASPFCIANFLVACFMPSWKALQIWRITISSAFMLYVIGPVSFLVIVQTASFHILAVLTSRRVVAWMTCLLCLFYLNSVSYEAILDESNSYLMGLVQSWVLMRNMSYCLDVQEKRAKASLVQALAHALYLPLLFSGPIVMYDEYLQQKTMRRPVGIMNARLKPLLAGLARYLFWGFILHLWLHLIYSAALSQMAWHLESLPISTVYAVVYCLGQFFMLKYAVIYGLSGTLARAEGIPTKEPPKCIARIHLYSDMWRLFDPGLYTFLNRYINRPLKEWSGSWLLASVCSFGFVYVWHGTAFYIFIWSALNWLGIALERLARNFLETLDKENETPRRKRIRALVATPLLLLAALSNGYFLANYETGNVFVSKFISSSTSSKLLLSVILYSCCFVSQQVKESEIRRKQVQRNPIKC